MHYMRMCVCIIYVFTFSKVELERSQKFSVRDRTSVALLVLLSMFTFRKKQCILLKRIFIKEICGLNWDLYIAIYNNYMHKVAKGR